MIVAILFAAFCVVLLILLILTYVDTLTKKIKLKYDQDPTNNIVGNLVMPMTAGSVPLPDFQPVTVDNMVRLSRQPIPIPGRNVYKRCRTNDQQDFYIARNPDNETVEITSPSDFSNPKVTKNVTWKVQNDDRSTDDACNVDDVIIFSQDGSEDPSKRKYLAYNDSCHDTRLIISDYIGKDNKSGCFTMQQDPMYPGYVRMKASRRNCDGQYVRWSPDCSNTVKLTSADMPESSNLEWKAEVVNS